MGNDLLADLALYIEPTLTLDCRCTYTGLDGPAAHQVHGKNSGVALDLPCQGGRLYVADQGGSLFALGHLKGSSDLQRCFQAGPAIYHGGLYTNLHSHIRAYTAGLAWILLGSSGMHCKRSGEASCLPGGEREDPRLSSTADIGRQADPTPGQNGQVPAL